MRTLLLFSTLACVAVTSSAHAQVAVDSIGLRDLSIHIWIPPSALRNGKPDSTIVDFIYRVKTRDGHTVTGHRIPTAHGTKIQSLLGGPDVEQSQIVSVTEIPHTRYWHAIDSMNYMRIISNVFHLDSIISTPMTK